MFDVWDMGDESKESQEFDASVSRPVAVVNLRIDPLAERVRSALFASDSVDDVDDIEDPTPALSPTPSLSTHSVPSSLSPVPMDRSRSVSSVSDAVARIDIESPVPTRRSTVNPPPAPKRAKRRPPPIEIPPPSMESPVIGRFTPPLETSSTGPTQSTQPTAPVQSAPSGAPPPCKKAKRGRPRKNPKPDPGSESTSSTTTTDTSPSLPVSVPVASQQGATTQSTQSTTSSSRSTGGRGTRKRVREQTQSSSGGGGGGASGPTSAPVVSTPPLHPVNATSTVPLVAPSPSSPTSAVLNLPANKRKSLAKSIKSAHPSKIGCIRPERFADLDFTRPPAPPRRQQAMVYVDYEQTVTRHTAYRDVLDAMPNAPTLMRMMRSSLDRRLLSVTDPCTRQLVFTGKRGSILDPGRSTLDVLYSDPFERFLYAMLLTLLQWNLYPLADDDTEHYYAAPNDESSWLAKLRKINTALELLLAKEQNGVSVPFDDAFEIIEETELELNGAMRAITTVKSDIYLSTRPDVDRLYGMPHCHQGAGCDCDLCTMDRSDGSSDSSSGSGDDGDYDEKVAVAVADGPVTGGLSGRPGPVQHGDYLAHKNNYAFWPGMRADKATHLRVRMFGEHCYTNTEYGTRIGSDEHSGELQRRRDLGLDLDPADPNVFMTVGQLGRGHAHIDFPFSLFTPRAATGTAAAFAGPRGGGVVVDGGPRGGVADGPRQHVSINRVSCQVHSAVFVPWFSERVDGRGVCGGTKLGSMQELFKGLVEVCVKLRPCKDKFPSIFETVYRFFRPYYFRRGREQYVQTCSYQLELLKVVCMKKGGHLVEDIIERYAGHLIECLKQQTSDKSRELLSHMFHALLPPSLLQQTAVVTTPRSTAAVSQLADPDATGDGAAVVVDDAWRDYVRRRMERGARLTTVEFFRATLTQFQLLHEFDTSTVVGADHLHLSNYAMTMQCRRFNEKLNLMSLPMRSVMCSLLYDRLPVDTVRIVLEFLYQDGKANTDCETLFRTEAVAYFDRITCERYFVTFKESQYRSIAAAAAEPPIAAELISAELPSTAQSENSGDCDDCGESENYPDGPQSPVRSPSPTR